MVIEKPTGNKKGETWRVGLADGRLLPLSLDNAPAQRKLGDRRRPLRCRKNWGGWQGQLSSAFSSISS